MRLEELVSVREIRAVIKERFLEFKDVTDPRVRIHLRPSLAAGLRCAASSTVVQRACLRCCCWQRSRHSHYNTGCRHLSVCAVYTSAVSRLKALQHKVELGTARSLHTPTACNSVIYKAPSAVY
jgi:hypothetical protein